MRRRAGAAAGVAALLGVLPAGAAAPAAVAGVALSSPGLAGGAACEETATTVVLSNTEVRLAFNKQNGRLESLQHRGRELLGRGGGYVQVAFTNKHDRPPEAWQFTIVRRDPSLVEIAFANADADCPFDLAAHYILRAGEPGFHQYFSFGHDAARAPGVHRLAQLNLCLRIDPRRFTTAAVDDRRITPFPAAAELTHAAMVADATYHLGGDRYYSKYFFAADMSEAHIVHGALGAEEGIWMILPSHEHLNGGPEHQELTVHQTDTTPVLLYHATAAHYGAGLIVSDSRQGSWHKVSAPAFVYVNTGRDAAALWSDAKARAEQQVAQWPYAWLDAAEFQLQRGAVSGTVHGAGGAPLARARVIVAPHDAPSSLDWQQQWRGYRFYGWTDDRGAFAIGKVRPGEYDVFVWQPGRFGEAVKRGVRVGAGESVAAGDLAWPSAPPRERLWQIGTPDRSAAEFGFAENFRQWALWEKIGRATQGRVDFTVGRNRDRDWPFEMAVVANAAGAWQAPEWRVHFADHGGRSGTAVLWLGIAAYDGRSSPQLTVTLNGQPIGEITDLEISGAAHRSGVHAGYQERTLEFDAGRLRSGENVLALALPPVAGDAAVHRLPAAALLWDSLRLEAAPVPPAPYAATR